jgi:hypothetical protein
MKLKTACRSERATTTKFRLIGRLKDGYRYYEVYTSVTLFHAPTPDQDGGGI